MHSLWHFTRVATEDLTHADSRLWRTLTALLFKPGRLTREFLAGRRARYLPPVRLYLVLSVLFFLIASAVHTRFTVLAFDADHPSHSKPLPANTVNDAVAGIATPRPGETTEQRAARVCANANYNGPGASTLRPQFQRACRNSVMDNGRDLQDAFLHNVPRAMFIFLPLLAGVMMLMYWRPRHYYVEHLLLFVHNHAFVFLVASLVLLLGSSCRTFRDWTWRSSCTLRGTCTAPCGSCTSRGACSPCPSSRCWVFFIWCSPRCCSRSPASIAL